MNYTDDKNDRKFDQSMAILQDKQAFTDRLLKVLFPMIIKVMIVMLIVVVGVIFGVNIFLLLNEFSLIGSVIQYEKAISSLCLSVSSLLKATLSVIHLYSEEIYSMSMFTQEHEKAIIQDELSTYKANILKIADIIRGTEIENEIMKEIYANKYYKYRIDGASLIRDDDTFIDISNSVCAEIKAILYGDNSAISKEDYIFIIYNSLNSLYPAILSTITNISQALLLKSNFSDGDTSLTIFYVVIVVTNMLIMLFFVFSRILSKAPISIMDIWLHMPIEYFINSINDIEEYIRLKEETYESHEVKTHNKYWHEQAKQENL